MLSPNAVPNKIKGNAYSRHFQGYIGVKVPKRNGNGFKIIQIYTAPYHVHDMSDDSWKNHKLKISGLTLAALGLYIFAAVCGADINKALFVAIPGCLAAFTLVFALTAIIFYLFCPRKMTINDCTVSVRQVKRWTSISSFCTGIVAIMSLVYLLLFTQGRNIRECIVFFAYTASAISLFFIYKIENNTEYCEVENNTELPFYPGCDF